MKFLSLVTAVTLVLLSACASLPTGPSVLALPGGGKSFDQFRADDGDCRMYALAQIGGADANRASVNAGVASAAVGTAIGAVAGAAIGGHQGAGVGAGTGLIVGSMAGAGAAQASAYGSQRTYDNAYVQCMYAKGHQVPIPGSAVRRSAYPPAAAPLAPPGYYPPPPPGTPPPPPAR